METFKYIAHSEFLKSISQDFSLFTSSVKVLFIFSICRLIFVAKNYCYFPFMDFLLIKKILLWKNWTDVKGYLTFPGIYIKDQGSSKEPHFLIELWNDVIINNIMVTEYTEHWLRNWKIGENINIIVDIFKLVYK